VPTVTITLSDTPAGSVAITSDHRPCVGAACSPAQAAALDIIARTRKQWSGTTPLPAEVDIDAVHLTRDRVVADPVTMAGLMALGPMRERGRGG